jgi:hypothetical protein
MPSPFPGMDPYLERPGLWPDVHLTLIIAMRAELNATLPPRYAASADAYVWIHEPDAAARIAYRPDVFVTDDNPQPPRGERTATIEAPASGVLPAYRKEGDKYLKIVDTDTNIVVTVIELLSPANKRLGPDRDAYLTKRLDYLGNGVNVVEIDLLRGGERTPVDDLTQAPTDYCVMVCRAEDLPRVDVWPFGLREPMPNIPIPLPTRADEPLLDLRRCLDRAYDEGKYRRKARYQDEPAPPIRPVDQEWAQSLLQQLPADHK